MQKNIFLSFGLFAILLVFVSFFNTNANDTLSCAGYSADFKKSSPALNQVASMKISTPQLIAVDTQKACAVLAWRTSSLSTSQIIYRTGRQNAYIDLINKDEAQYWGYPYGSKQNNDAQAYHIMIIKDLKLNERYFARSVSRPFETALPYISDELSFVFQEPESSTQSNIAPVDANNANNTTKQSQYATKHMTNTAKIKPAQTEYKYKFKYSFKNSKDNTHTTHDYEKFPVYNKTAKNILGDVFEDKKGPKLISSQDIYKDRKEQVSSSQKNTEASNESSAPDTNIEEKLNKAVSALSAYSSSVELKNSLSNLTEKAERYLNDKLDGKTELHGLSLIIITAVLLGLLYAIQRFVENYKEECGKYKAQFWTIGPLILSLIFIFVSKKLAMIFFAVFLIALAWLLFKSAIDDLAEDKIDADKLQTNDDRELKDTELEKK